MKIPAGVSVLCAGIYGLSLVLVPAANINKADVPDNLNLGTSWVGGVVPGGTDVATWNNTVQVNTSSSPGGSLNWDGIQILDPAGSITINADGNSLELGGSGIDLSLATNGLTVACPVILGANQNWAVTNGQKLTVSGVVSGTSALSFSGGGMTELSGANTYSGGTFINGTEVEPNNAACFGSAAVNVTNSGDYLLFDVFPNGGIIANRNEVAGPMTLDLYNRSVSVVMDGAWAGNGTVLVTNMASGATLTLGGNGTGGDMGGFTGTITIADTNSTGNASAGALRFNNGGANHNVGNASAIFNLGNGSVQFTEKNGGVTTYFGALSGGPGTQLAKNENYVIGGANLNTSFAGTIMSSSSLTKTGTGTFTLSGNNPYTGSTTVSGGVLQVGDGVTIGAGAMGAGAVINNATLVFNRPDNTSVTNAISGTGDTTKENTNTLTYYGTNSSSGTLVIDQGSLAVGVSAQISSAIFVASNATFDVSQNPSFSLSSTLSGFGAVTGTLASAGATISPGQPNAAGTLTFLSGLSESGSVTHQMEVSRPAGTNDLINVVGNLSLTGLNTVQLSAFGGGIIPSGIYPVINYSGTLTGGLNNLQVSLVGALGILTNPPGAIEVIVTPPPRGPTNLTWVGNSVVNNWDINTSTNWVNDSRFFTFLNGDTVTFDDTGLANPNVNLGATVQPAAVSVNSTGNYTISGIGDIDGSASLTKTNTGTLTILTTNTYSGPTTIAGGTLAVMDLENGTLPSSIGAADSNPTNLVFNGGALSYLGAGAATDHGMIIGNGGADFSVASGANLTLNGPLTGIGAVTASGPGSLTLTAANNYGAGTVLSNALLILGSDAANNSGLGATNEPVTFLGGTLQLFGYNGSTSPNYATCYNPLVVPAGQTGTLQMFPRGPLNSGAGSGLESSLTGSGTLNLVVNYLRDNLDGNWSAFSGLINVTPRNPTGDEMRIDNSFGYSNATIFINDNVNLDRANTGGTTNDIGALGGTSLATVAAGNSSGANTTWRVGWLNSTSTFAGSINSDNSIIKVGTGEWILTGQNLYYGSTTISQGILALAAGVNGDASIYYTTNIFIASGAILDVSGNSSPTLALTAGQNLEGSGTINGSLDNTGGGVISPGEGANTGALTATNQINLGGTLIVKLNTSAPLTSDQLTAPTILLESGSIIVTNVGPGLRPGDAFVLFNGAVSGTVGSVTLPNPNYYTWDTSQLAVNGTIKLAAIAKPSISNINTAGLSGGVIVINGSGATNGPVNILETTNVALPLTDWTSVFTGAFDGNGNLSATVTVNPAQPQQFFLLQAQ